MILVEGTIRVGDRDLPFSGSFFSKSGVKSFVDRENAQGGNLRVVSEDYKHNWNREE